MSDDHSTTGGRPLTQRPVDRRTFVRTGAAVVAGAAAIGLGSRSDKGHGDLGLTATTASLAVPRTSEVPRDPMHSAWRGVPDLVVPLLPQTMAAPRLTMDDLVVPEIRLQMQHTGSEIGFRLDWTDDGVDDLEAIGRFRDSVAVQMPVLDDEPTTVAMGQRDRPVHVLHWRSSWQRELDEGPRTLRRAYPNAVNEMPPGQVLGETADSMLSPAVAAGNVVAVRRRVSAVEELQGQGLGTFAAYDEQRAEGRGVHGDGRWAVVIVMPMKGGKNQVTLSPGRPTLVALAAWNGGRGNRGARKQWSHWLRAELEA